MEVTPTFVDFESRSRADLREIGGRLYWEHPSTEVLCAVLAHEGTRYVWIPALHGPWTPPPVDALAAHNLDGFDIFAWRALGWPEPRRMVDTATLARRAGIGGGLEKVARLVGRDVKDKEGSRLTVGLSTCRRPTKKTAHLSPLSGPGPDAAALRAMLDAYYPASSACVVAGHKIKARPALVPGEVPAVEWATFTEAEKARWGVQAVPTVEDLVRVAEYCSLDVDALVLAWPYLAPFVDLENDVEAAHRAVNDRGICFDRELARALLRVDARQAEEAVAAVGLTARDLRSPARFRELTGAVDAKFEAVDALAHDPRASDRVRAIATARLALASIARGKLLAGQARTSADGRMRDAHAYLQAHTGRWAGRGLQVHNIPWIDKAAAAARGRESA